MKTKIVILLVLIVGVGTVAYMSATNKPKDIEKEQVVPVVTSMIPTSGQYCFVRIQQATETAPYSSEEHVVLNFNGAQVSGTKKGTQVGPDMSNGFEGKLSGAMIEDEIELTYSYTVEGSNGKELEVYTFADKNLIKKRWVLEDKKINGENILVPDYVGEPTLYTYTPETCGN